MYTHARTQSGFTLVEMIVSLAVFSVVITISVGALLVLIASNQQLQSEQSVMTNLSFALDSMTREMRTGTNYFCASTNNLSPGVLTGPGFSGPAADRPNIFNPSVNVDALPEERTRDCENGVQPGNSYQGVAFLESGDSITGAGNERILYYFDDTQGELFRRVGSQPPRSIVSSGIHITHAEFFVTGSKPVSAGNPDEEDQAAITIFIEAREADSPTAKPYRIQTTVTQRILDI